MISILRIQSVFSPCMRWPMISCALQLSPPSFTWLQSSEIPDNKECSVSGVRLNISMALANSKRILIEVERLVFISRSLPPSSTDLRVLVSKMSTVPVLQPRCQLTLASSWMGISVCWKFNDCLCMFTQDTYMDDARRSKFESDNFIFSGCQNSPCSETLSG